jgi:hypothetical protein
MSAVARAVLSLSVGERGHLVNLTDGHTFTQLN